MVRFLFFLYILLSLVLSAKSLPPDYDGWPFESFETGDWEPPHFALRKVSDDSIDPGLIFISARNYNLEKGTAPTIWDNNADMVWQGPHEKTMDFKVQKLFGQDVITFWDGETGVLGYGYGKVHILDNMYRNIYTVTLEDDITTPSGESRESYVDVHEHLITEHNTIIVSAINITQMDLSDVPGGGKPDMFVIVPLFYEIDIPTNQVLFKWDAKEHAAEIPLSQSRQTFRLGTAQNAPWDGYHMNSIHPTKDGYLISIRFFSSVFYLNKDGSVRWQLAGDGDGGDFELDDVRFSWQHDARVFEETDEHLILSVFNNAATRFWEESSSTGVAMKVDLVNMKASPLYNLTDPHEPLIGRTQGSFQFIRGSDQGNVLLGYGSTPFIKEYDRDGNVVLTGNYGGGQAGCYRAFKFPWHATPYWDPEIAVKHTTSYITDIYMSWNGATDYDNWVIFSVPSANSTRRTPLATHKRTGFETHVVLENAQAKYIMAAARQGDTILRYSRVIEFAS